MAFAESSPSPRRVSIRQRPEWDGFEIMVGDDNLAELTRKVTTVHKAGSIPRVIIETVSLTDVDAESASVVVIPEDILNWVAICVENEALAPDMAEQGRALLKRWGRDA